MTPPKRGKFPKNIPYHDVFMGTLPSSRRGKCVTFFGGGLPRNEVADDLANVAASNPVDLEDHVVLTSTEIYSRAKDLICRTWVVPPVQPLYFQSHPGSAISFKGSRSYQTAFLLFSTGRLKCMKFEGGKKTFSICTK
ncbi:RNase H domain-containing protein [Trichonephila clavipes]|nr:RNase H domain-containing protein [Trichonephila clavipes]